MRYFKHDAFSAFECLCVIIIFAILSSIGVRYLGYIADKQCILALKAKLNLTQSALSDYYARSFLTADSIDTMYASSILMRLMQSPKPKCYFTVHTDSIIATVGTQNIHFYVQPATLAVNPRIFCELSQPLCKAFSDRILDK